MSKTGQLLSIQYLRAAAALAVVAYHSLQWCAGGFELGRAGVDIFFIISGVIMWRVTCGRERSAVNFLWRRFSRVAPGYWLASLTVAALAAVWPWFLPQVSPDLTALFQSLLFWPHFDPAGRPFPTLPPGWTLSYEMAFYGLFAMGLLAPLRDRARWITAGLFVVVLLGLTLQNPLYVLLANPMLLEFAAGLWLGKAVEAGGLPGAKVGGVMILAGLTLFAVLRPGVIFSELLRPFLWGGPAVLIVAGALAIEAAGKLPAWPTLTRLGDASYALYIWHLPAVAVVAHSLGIAGPVWIFLPTCLAVAILAGFAGQALIERPINRFVRRQPDQLTETLATGGL